MARFCLLVLFSLSNEITALAPQTRSRRAFLSQLPVVLSAAAAVQPAEAYERRDVGGADRSPEQWAFNEQAYETNNRLERDGLKLETQAEQKASLTAALSDYTYDSTSSNIKGSSKKENKEKKK